MKVRIPWWLPVAIGLICVAAGFPAEGLLGIALAVIGVALVWLGYAKQRRVTEEGDS